MPKKLLSSLAAAGLLLSLAACSSDSGAETAEGCLPSGANSDQVEVTGEAGATPSVEFSSPLTTTAPERTVVDEGPGEGEALADGGSATVDIQAYNATTGDQVQALTAVDLAYSIGQTAPFFDDVALCSTAGSRVVGVVPPIEEVAQTGQDIGLGATDSVVVVIDVTEVSEPVEVLPRAEGEAQPAPEGLPTVELADDGAPTITVPATDPPADLQIATLIQGEGTEVAAGDTVTVHYTGVVWATGEVFDSSWERGQPSPFPTDGVIEGFSAALVGQTVGSQVIAAIPPAQGYGERGEPDAGIGPTDTLVFVADILATQ